MNHENEITNSEPELVGADLYLACKALFQEEAMR